VLIRNFYIASTPNFLTHICSQLDPTTTINTFQPKQPTTNQQTINMSDLGRKGLGEQAQEKRTLTSPHLLTSEHYANFPPVTPQSQKSTGDKVGESVTGLGDKAASAVQPGTSSSTPSPTFMTVH
jgi:hypothetical protein